jgi:hypothetical protein
MWQLLNVLRVAGLKVLDVERQNPAIFYGGALVFIARTTTWPGAAIGCGPIRWH